MADLIQTATSLRQVKETVQALPALTFPNELVVTRIGDILGLHAVWPRDNGNSDTPVGNPVGLDLLSTPVATSVEISAPLAYFQNNSKAGTSQAVRVPAPTKVAMNTSMARTFGPLNLALQFSLMYSCFCQK
jgi:hypothetical protein